MWTLSLIACGWFRPDPNFLDEVPGGSPTRPSSAPCAIPLARGQLQLTLELPDSSRPGGEPAPEAFGLVGALEHHEDRRGTRIYRTPLPVHENLLPSRSGGTHAFGVKPPPGLEVRGPGGALAFERRGRSPGTWGFDRDFLYIGLPASAPAPDTSDYTVVFPRATRAEDQLNLASSDLRPEAFAQRTLTVGATSHTGLYLPAPASAAFSVTVPEAGRLAFEATILPPAIASSQRSDGATIRVSVEHQGERTPIGTISPRLDTWSPARMDLSAFAGQAIQLWIETDPGATPTYDHVFLEGPVIYTPDPDPRRVVLIFVDTLRADHLGFMGYERDTTPLLDRWSRHAAVFTDARTVAPWTLPSTRAVLSGEQPERWFEIESLPERLGAAGFRTEAIVANAFLSHPFDLHRGWDRYHFEHLLDAEALSRRARDIIAAHDDRDLLLMINFMEAHIPYSEPSRLRGMFAGDRPEGLTSLARHELNDWSPEDDGFEAVKDYVVGRYDQNVRAVDESLLYLLHAAGNGADVVLFSDHGEELWEHGGFEHGHTLFDELLHVPLAIRSPHLPGGTHSAPVSLLDITPTVLELVGLPQTHGPGRSLVPLAWGDEGAEGELQQRPQALGRPLYGDDGWGVWVDGHKWWDREGVQRLYQLSDDPGELHDLAPSADLTPYPQALSEALDRRLQRVWRTTLRSMNWPHEVKVTLSHPEGIKEVWRGYDPRGAGPTIPIELVDGRVQLTVPPLTRPPPLLYLIPNGDPLEPDGLAITFIGPKLRTGSIAEGKGRMTPSAARDVVMYAGDPRFSAAVDLAWAPEPDGIEVTGFHPDAEDQLRELGYLDD
ncbi:MAG TPA: hypothetical protein ENK18_09820 [Deltaproteobacteria bacterium]|nr:hypothetical protein [Deltaproteobacteria bacterium]